MSKYQEALEKLCKVKIYQKEASAYDYLGKEVYKEEINLIKQALDRLETLELEVHCKNNSIKILEAFHKSQIEIYLQKQNKLLDELIIRKQQIKILKKALPYYDIKVLCNAGRITQEELEILLKYEEIK